MPVSLPAWVVVGVWVALLSVLYAVLLVTRMSVSLAALGDKMVRDIRPGAAFEPTYIYRLLTVIKSSLSEKVWGVLWQLGGGPCL